MNNSSPHPLDDWARDLGKLVSALQSLEFVLPAFLYEREDALGGRFPYSHNVYSDTAGQVVPLNALTDYRTLGQLITAYNALVSASRSEATVDFAVVAVRDAIAHGRVSAMEPGEALDLVKYDKPTKADPGIVRVAVRVHVTRAWMLEQVKIVQSQTVRVVRAHEELPKHGTV